MVCVVETIDVSKRDVGRGGEVAGRGEVSGRRGGFGAERGAVMRVAM